MKKPAWQFWKKYFSKIEQVKKLEGVLKSSAPKDYGGERKAWPQRILDPKLKPLR